MPLALLLEELALLDERIGELLDDDRTLDESGKLDELLLIELELVTELERPQPPAMPNGEGWLAQVDTEIQLLLFS
jgi:hypothetical protein